jgi:hypothetical protein
MSLALALIAAALSRPTLAVDECSISQRDSGCCEPLGDIADNWEFTSTGAGTWTGTDSFIRFDFANSQDCGGDAAQTQDGVATLNLNEAKEIKLLLSMTGVAEAQYETYELFVDDVLVVTVQAENGQGGSDCQVSTCIMCDVSMPQEAYILSPGTHKIEVKVSSLDGAYHQGAYFEIAFGVDSTDCGGCVCSPPSPAPADGNCVLTLGEDDDRRLQADGGAAPRRLETVPNCGPEGIVGCGGKTCFALFNEAVDTIQNPDDGSNDPDDDVEGDLCSMALEMVKAECPQCDACGVYTVLPPEPSTVEAAAEVAAFEAQRLHALLGGVAVAEPGAFTAIAAAALLSLLLGSLVALRRRRVTLVAGSSDQQGEEESAPDRHPLTLSS